MNIFELFYNSVSDERIIEAIKKINDVNVKDECGCTPLYYACLFGKLEIIKYLIENGADVNIKDKYGSTPLYCVCFLNKIEFVKLLIENGADVQNEFEDCFKTKYIKGIKSLTKAGACFL